MSPNLDLFALRGMSISPLPRVRAIGADPVSAWRAGDPVMIARLAEVEMARVGVEFTVGSNTPNSTVRMPAER